MNNDVLDFEKVRKDKLAYIGVTLATLALPVYKVSFFGISESVSGFGLLFTGFNFIFLIVMLLGLLSEILPSVRDHELVVQNRKTIDLALPVIFALMIIFMIVQTSNAGMGFGNPTLSSYLLVIAHVAYLLYELGVFDQFIKKDIKEN